jgi:Holliday junction resolvase RusA-like endonuclease
MKYCNKSPILALAALSSVSAFAPNVFSSKVRSCLSAVVTGPDGKAATSKEEDIALTLAIIMAHDSRSVTITAEQFAVQFSAGESDEVDAEVDVSIPYDATAKNAYEASDKSTAYDDFKTKYLADAVALVKSKQPVDVSIPYDATAKNAYEASDKSMAYTAFKAKYLADAVALVKSKQPVDVSIPYDATAKNAYEASDKSMTYAAFKAKYLADAVALVKSKQPVDVSIPYDAAAKNAYEASDKSMTYADFKAKYETDAVASVIAKKSA